MDECDCLITGIHNTLLHPPRPVTSAFGLITSDLPAIVALSGKRMRYATLPKTASDSETIKTFIDGVLGGTVRTPVLQVGAVVS